MTMRLEDVDKTVPKVPTDAYLAAARFLSKHTLSLLKIQPYPTPPAVVGTGSLIFLRGKHFLLTAGHVWEAFLSETNIYIQRVEGITHSYFIPKAALTATAFEEFGAEITDQSRDLVLLEIPTPIVREIEATHSFHAIAQEKQEPENDDLKWQPDYIAMGTPGVLSHEEPDGRYFEMRGFWCHPCEYVEMEDQDFVVVRPHQEEEADLKKITYFGGMSGGGFWEVLYYNDENGKIDFNVRFLGVVFWQDVDLLRCQGRKTLSSLVKLLKSDEPTK